MINGKKTDREIIMESDLKLLGMNWVARVINQQDFKSSGELFEISTEYKSSKGDTLDSITHKVKLDLITNLKYEFTNPIKVMIKKDDDKIKIADEINIMKN
jgi:hypothetical protein